MNLFHTTGRHVELLHERGFQGSGIFFLACGDGQLLMGH